MKTKSDFPKESFISHGEKFTILNNNVLYNRSLSMKAKGLYAMIRGRINYAEVPLTKKWLMAGCTEGERVFNKTWDELKHAGLLIVNVYPAENGRFRYVYELMDNNEHWDGVYLRYYDANGNVSSTNLTMEKKGHYPQNVPTGKKASDQCLQNRTSGNRTGGKQCSGDVGSKNKYSKINTLVNYSINHSTQQQIEESEDLEDTVAEELQENNAIPADYVAQPDKMQTALRILTAYDFRQQNPYKTPAKRVDTTRMDAFELFFNSLCEMTTAVNKRSYHGNAVSAEQIVESLNKICEDCSEGVLEPLVHYALNDFLEATATRSIKNHKKYMQSVIWSVLGDYNVRRSATVSRAMNGKRQ